MFLLTAMLACGEDNAKTEPAPTPTAAPAAVEEKPPAEEVDAAAAEVEAPGGEAPGGEAAEGEAAEGEAVEGEAAEGDAAEKHRPKSPPKKMRKPGAPPSGKRMRKPGGG